MGLRSMLVVIRTIAKHSIMADGIGDWRNDKQIVSAASRVLADWPANFIALLEDIGRQLPADISGGVGLEKSGMNSSYVKLGCLRNYIPTLGEAFTHDHFYDSTCSCTYSGSVQTIHAANMGRTPKSTNTGRNE